MNEKELDRIAALIVEDINKKIYKLSKKDSRYALKSVIEELEIYVETFE